MEGSLFRIQEALSYSPRTINLGWLAGEMGEGRSGVGSSSATYQVQGTQEKMGPRDASEMAQQLSFHCPCRGPGVQFPAPTRWLTSIHNSSVKGPDILFRPPQTLCSHTYTQAKHSLTYRKIHNSQKRVSGFHMRYVCTCTHILHTYTKQTNQQNK